MRTVNLGEESPDLKQVINMARQEPVLLLTAEGQEFLVSEADDFEKEVDALRKSQAFQKFLDERSLHSRGIPLEEVEEEIEKELAEHQKSR